MSYSLLQYAQMVGDQVRVDAYDAALKSVITPDSIVLDIGAGTGIFSLLACKHGAKRVYAVETNSAIEVARQLAKANGFEDRISFLQSEIEDTTLPEKVDIIVSDLRGVLPIYRKHLETISKARREHLKPEGVMIPASDQLILCVADAPAAYSSCVELVAPDAYGLKFEALQEQLVNNWNRQDVKDCTLLASPGCWTKLDYNTIEQVDCAGVVQQEIHTSGCTHGFYLWFEASVSDSISYSGGPESKVSSYGSVFFPFPRPLDVLAGEIISIDLSAKLIANDYTWVWKTIIESNGKADPERCFEQSTFFADSFSQTDLVEKTLPK